MGTTATMTAERLMQEFPHGSRFCLCEGHVWVACWAVAGRTVELTRWVRVKGSATAFFRRRPSRRRVRKVIRASALIQPHNGDGFAWWHHPDR